MTKKAALFIADGSEEVEAITPVDLLRRAKIDVDVVSIMDSKKITASRGVVIEADKLLSEISFDDYDMLILPGGIKGTDNLKKCEVLSEQLVRFKNEGKGIAAICAAPTVLGELGLLAGNNATCNPGFWNELNMCGALVDDDSKAVTCANIITSQAMGTSVDFGLAIVAYLAGQEEADKLKANIRF